MSGSGKVRVCCGVIVGTYKVAVASIETPTVSGLTGTSPSIGGPDRQLLSHFIRFWRAGNRFAVNERRNLLRPAIVLPALSPSALRST
jgi:hypothetical protein